MDRSDGGDRRPALESAARCCAGTRTSGISRGCRIRTSPRRRPSSRARIDGGSARAARGARLGRSGDEAGDLGRRLLDGAHVARPQAARSSRCSTRCSARGDVMIQQLVPEIRTHGEISLMFFGGVFSHAVSKRPQAGEFRVQERLGGRSRAPTAAARWSITRASCSRRARRARLYARVDVGQPATIRPDGNRARRAEPVSRARPGVGRRLRAGGAAHRVIAYADGRGRRAAARNTAVSGAIFVASAQRLPLADGYDDSLILLLRRGVALLPRRGCGSSSPAAPTVAADVTISMVGDRGTSPTRRTRRRCASARRWRGRTTTRPRTTRRRTRRAFRPARSMPARRAPPLTMSTAGTFAYHCTIHPGMVGTLVVQ